MTERREFPKYNCDIFEANGLDDASAIMHLFDKKNRRVNRIFNNYDDNNTEENSQTEGKSFDLHLISRRDSKIEKENLKCTTISPSRSNKNSIRALSPVDIIVASDEEICEHPKVREQLKEPVVNTKPKRSNTSLRRSLFNQPTSEKRLAGIELICSTPVTQRVHQQESFFNEIETVESFSPIRKNITKNVSDSNACVKEKAANNQEENNECVEQIQSLGIIENDLRDQYQIEKTPSRNRRRSIISERSYASQPAPSTKGLSASKECSVQIHPMDISEDIISNYRRNQVRRLSMSNQTDINSIKIIETPLNNRQQSVHCDSMLAKKLQQCETDDSDMTLDEEIIHQVQTSRASKKSIRSSNIISTQNNHQTQNIIISNDDANNDCQFRIINEAEKQNFRNITEKSPEINPMEKNEDFNDHNTQNHSIQNTSGLHNNISEENEEIVINSNKIVNEDSETGEEANTNSPETIVFKKPTILPILSMKGKRTTIEASNSSMNDQVSESLVESLRKTINESSSSFVPQAQTQTTQLQLSNSQRYSIRRRKIITKNKNISKNLENYMKLAKNIKGKEKTTNSSRKRKLFTNTSNIDEENFKDEENNAEQQLKETSQQTLLMDNESDHDIRTTVDEIRKSLDSLSNASSDFNAEIPCKTPKKSSSQFKEINEKIDNKKVSEQLKKRCRSPSTDKKLTKHKKKKNMHNDNDDEGFGSDNSRTDIKYDPNKNDNIRKGLRIRRYPKVWWRHDAEADNYGLVYRCYSKNDYLAEKKLKNSNMHKKEQHQVKKTSTKLKGVTKKQIKPKLSTINENGNSDNESNASEAVSTCSFKTATSRSETIKKVFDSYTLERNENIPSKTKITDSYDLQQISRLDWTQCGTDILYHQFIHTKNDGFIQFLPGAKKSKAKTKRSILKFVLLSGKIDFYVNNQIETLEHLGYISIQPGNIYSVQNPYEHPAILTFTKLDSSSSDLSISVE